MPRIPSIRRGRSRPQVTADLGFLAELSGTWEGFGFNLIGRPDKQGGSPVFLELNQTFETLSFTPISSTIPNRGFAVDDIELFGLTYLQKITDTVTGGALHIEPGIWIHVPSQDNGCVQSVARMGTIPHGNSLLAQGSAIKLDPFNGNPFDPDKVAAANTAPFPVEDAFPATATPPGTGKGMPVPGTLSGFPPYDLFEPHSGVDKLSDARRKRPSDRVANDDPWRSDAGRHSRSDQTSDRRSLGPNDFQHGCDQHRHGPQSAAAAADPEQRSAAAPRRHPSERPGGWRGNREYPVPANQRRCRNHVRDVLDRRNLSTDQVPAAPICANCFSELSRSWSELRSSI